VCLINTTLSTPRERIVIGTAEINTHNDIGTQVVVKWGDRETFVPRESSASGVRKNHSFNSFFKSRVWSGIPPRAVTGALHTLKARKDSVLAGPEVIRKDHERERGRASEREGERERESEEA